MQYLPLKTISYDSRVYKDDSGKLPASGVMRYPLTTLVLEALSTEIRRAALVIAFSKMYFTYCAVRDWVQLDYSISQGSRRVIL